MSQDQIITQGMSQFEHIRRYWDPQWNVPMAKLLPGQYYIGKQTEGIITTLGSCVSACIWDAEAHIGGMNHFMLPLTDKQQSEVSWGGKSGVSDATRYGNHAMEELINYILMYGGRRQNLQAKIFGGAQILSYMGDVGSKNCQFALDYLGNENINIVTQDLYKDYPRKVIFFPASGKVYMKKIRALKSEVIIQQEKSYQADLAGHPIDGGAELF